MKKRLMFIFTLTFLLGVVFSAIPVNAETTISYYDVDNCGVKETIKKDGNYLKIYKASGTLYRSYYISTDYWYVDSYGNFDTTPGGDLLAVSTGTYHKYMLICPANNTTSYYREGSSSQYTFMITFTDTDGDGATDLTLGVNDTSIVILTINGYKQYDFGGNDLFYTVATDLDGVAGNELYFYHYDLWNNRDILIINNKTKKTKAFDFPNDFSYSGIIDTDGDSDKEIIIQRISSDVNPNGFNVKVLDYAENTTREYKQGGKLPYNASISISSFLNHDGRPGNEIKLFVSEHYGSSYYKYICDRTGTIY